MTNQNFTKRIMIVDDEPALLEVFSLYFSDKGWEVARAKNGKDALAQLEAFQPQVILADIHMPVMNGIEFLQALYDSKNEVPLIFITGFRDLELTQRAWGLGAFDFLDKPINIQKVLLIAENALEYGRDYVIAARKRFLKNAL